MWTLILIGVAGGLLTGVSPCVLPMLPIIFFASGTDSTSGRSARRAEEEPVLGATGSESGVGSPIRIDTPQHPARRPALIICGLVLSFSVFALTGSLLLTALGLPQGFLRWAGLTALLVIGASLIFPAVEELIQRPFRRLPRITRAGSGNAFVLGLGLGTLYVPCAGPVLAAITIAGASGSINGGIIALTIAFAIGMAVPLFFFGLAGRKIGQRVARYRTRARGFRVAGGLVMMLLAGALAFNLTDRLQRAVPNYTQALQEQVEANPAAQAALAGIGPAADAAPAPISTPADRSASSASSAAPVPAAPQACTQGAPTLVDCGAAPSIRGIAQWFNTPGNAPLSLQSLHGKVVLVEFWAFSCINCQRALPHVKEWDAAYRAAGLQVIGVHTPEFAFEREPDNVAESIQEMGISYPVALDNLAQTWTNFHNRWWPALYLIDADGTIRHQAIGEGGYATTERLIRELLVSADPAVTLTAPVEPGV